MNERERSWVIFALVYAVLNVAVPYIFLKDMGNLLGVFLFWNLITAAVLAAGVWFTSSWGKTEGEGELPE